MNSFKLLFPLILICGCSATYKFKPVRVDQFRVEFQDELTQDDYDFALHSLDIQIKQWQKDNGNSKPATIKISPRLSFRLQVGNQYKKCRGYYRYPDEIVVMLGRFNVLPALYHELCHLNRAPKDTNHSHNSWPWWTRQQIKLKDKLISDWFDKHGN